VAKTQKKRFVHSIISKRIVSLTMFLNALFFVIVMAFVAFVFVQQYETSSGQNTQNTAITLATSMDHLVEEVVRDGAYLASDASVIAYLDYVLDHEIEVITDPNDPHYEVYRDFMMKLEGVYSHRDDVYHRVFLAIDDDGCSSGDGCRITHEATLSAPSWQLSEQAWFYDLGDEAYRFSQPYVDGDDTRLITLVHPVQATSGDVGYIGIDMIYSNLVSWIDAQNNAMDEATHVVLYLDRETPQILYVSHPDHGGYRLLEGTDILSLDQTLGFGDSGMSYLIAHSSQSGQPQKLAIFGQKQLVGYSAVSSSDWVVAVMTEIPAYFLLEYFFLILFGGVLVILWLISLIVSHRIRKTLSPIGDILLAIDDIKQGNYHVNVAISENNELQSVGEALNLMSQEIGKQVELVYKSVAFDPLTGLKNRKASHQELDAALENSNDKMAICLLEIANLQSVNVLKGQSVAEELVSKVAERLKAHVPDRHYLYNNGGYEFIFIIGNVMSLERIEKELNRILDKFIEPVSFKNLKVNVRFNVGISVYPSDGKSINDLIKKAETALYKARQNLGGNFVFYNDQLIKEVSYKAEISEQLALAIKNEQLYLRYQPLIDNRNEIYGFEALMRWNSPTLGEISPNVFVSNAEESHLIIPIGHWVLREACLAQVAMRKRFDKKFVMSVNVSPVQLLQKDFIDNLKVIIRETEIDPTFLVLEVTEGVLIESSIYLEEVIKYLHEIGAKIALDDFGTGYASLTYLKQIPFDNLKIDKSFIDGIFGPKKEHAIVEKIVQLAHTLEMKVIAEGVEKRKQYEYLRQIQADVFQGFLFSKPLSFDDSCRYIDQFLKVAKNKRIDVFAGKDFSE
jgi:diguanylate cyclase (GGDEF)-like protein